MIFENRVKDYIVELKNSGVIIDGDILGVNEDLKTSKCIGRFLEDGMINEKLIYVYEYNNNLTWNLLNPLKSETEELV
jgi:hypothetical protein